MFLFCVVMSLGVIPTPFAADGSIWHLAQDFVVDGGVMRDGARQIYWRSEMKAEKGKRLG